VDLRLASFTFTVCIVASCALAQDQDSVSCERKIEKVLIPVVTTYWRGARFRKVVAARIPAGTIVRRCAPNHRFGIELDGRLVWIDGFAVQIEGADPELTPPPGDHEKTAGQRAQAPAPGTPGNIIAKLPRSLTVAEREEIAEIAKTKPMIDVEVYFDNNSDSIRPEAIPALQELGRVLSEDPLKGADLLIAGHTDARGSASKNYLLSERRAQAVSRYLIEKFNIPPTLLIVVGYGKDKIKDPNQPFSPRNRRVQIVNMNIKAVAPAQR
jgi:outer membrane protein OmpA-like peptidoglycan-associated protein